MTGFWVRNESVAVVDMLESEQWLCQLFRPNSSWDTSCRPMPVRLPCWLWRRTGERKRETDFQGTWLGCLSNVGGLPWAVTKCSYNPLISRLMENRNNSCINALSYAGIFCKTTFTCLCIEVYLPWSENSFCCCVRYRCLEMAPVSLSFKALRYIRLQLT